MSQNSVSPKGSTHGNKYLTALLLVAVVVGMFAATMSHLLF